MLEFLEENPLVGSIAAINSLGYVAAGILARHGIRNVSVLTFDLTEENRKCLKAGTISAVISLHPELQGYDAVRSAIRYLLYKTTGKSISHLTLIDIIVAENLPYYKNIFSE